MHAATGCYPPCRPGPPTRGRCSMTRSCVAQWSCEAPALKLAPRSGQILPYPRLQIEVRQTGFVHHALKCCRGFCSSFWLASQHPNLQGRAEPLLFLTPTPSTQETVHYPQAPQAQGVTFFPWYRPYAHNALTLSLEGRGIAAVAHTKEERSHLRASARGYGANASPCKRQAQRGLTRAPGIAIIRGEGARRAPCS
jgi:hypothetical protein